MAAPKYYLFFNSIKLMMSSIQKFTEDLRRFVAKAQAIEKNDPHKSIPYYLKIAEFIMAYIKQPNISESFRFTMKKQVKNIIAKVEDIRATPQLSPSLRAEIEVKKAKGEFIEKEIDESDLFNLPDVPTDSDFDTASSNQITSDAPPSSLSSGSSNLTPQSQSSDTSKKNFEEMDALSQQIDFLKEVSPLPFSGPITPFNKDEVSKRIKEDNGAIRIDDSDIIRKEETDLNLNVNLNSSQGNLQIGPNIGFAKDKISSAIQKQSKPDPLSSGQGLHSTTNPNEKICFACGTPMKKNEENCAVCGASNSNSNLN